MELKDLREFLTKLDSMDLMGRDLHIQYSILKNADRVIGERIEEIGHIILGEMNHQGEIKKEFEFGKFTIAKRKSYE